MNVVYQELWFCADCTITACTIASCKDDESCVECDFADYERYREIKRGLTRLGPNLELDYQEQDYQDDQDAQEYQGYHCTDCYANFPRSIRINNPDCQGCPDETCCENGDGCDEVRKMDACPYCKSPEIEEREAGWKAYSDKPCDCCGTRFAGDRTRFALPAELSLTSQPSSPSYIDQSVAPDSVWIPKGKSIKIAGYSISDGLIYFGSGLKSVDRLEVEPALIDPKLAVHSSNPERAGKGMGYWPSYSEIPPGCRAAFLEWLSTGRKDPDIYIGYVFMYFYGLERRALADARASDTASAEIGTILDEATRLLSIYGLNCCFDEYCSEFIEFIKMDGLKKCLYQQKPTYSLPCYEMPSPIKLALGEIVADGAVLTAEWAVAWVLTDPATPRWPAVNRCQDEFTELFTHKYAETYGAGIKFTPDETATYRPASASFSGAIAIPVNGILDITDLMEPIATLRRIADACVNELGAYRRYVSLGSRAGVEFRNLSNWLQCQVSEEPTNVACANLLSLVPSLVGNTSFSKRESTALALVLGKLDVGIEPDPRFGAFIPKPDQDVVLFKMKGCTLTAPTSEYTVATIVLHLTSAVAGANGITNLKQKRQLLDHLEKWLRLSRDEKMRLRAHFEWLLTAFPGMKGVKKRLEILNREQRESLGRFLVSVAQAAGYIDPAKMKLLTKNYQMLGMDALALYSHLHVAAIEPVTVEVADFASPRYAIPARTSQSTGIVLNVGTINAKLAETETVSAMLNNIFVEEDPGPVKPEESLGSEVSIAGLDVDSFAFMKVLAEKAVWSREDLENLAAEHSVMLDGTLDSINDASFDYFGGPFFEGWDPIEINAEYAKEISG